MNALLDAKVGYEDVERLIEDADDLGLANDGTVASRQIRDEGAEEEMLRCFLSICVRQTVSNKTNALFARSFLVVHCAAVCATFSMSM